MPTFRDHAYDILRGDPVLSPQNRADIWDLFHVHSKDAGELAQHLQAVPGLPDDTRAQLIAAKSKPAMEYDNLDRTVQAIERMAALPSQVLETAENHPHVLGHYMANQE